MNNGSSDLSGKIITEIMSLETTVTQMDKVLEISFRENGPSAGKMHALENGLCLLPQGSSIVIRNIFNSKIKEKLAGKSIPKMLDN